jgi:isocitrate/isopropylmalate dehydrogenase
MANPTGMLRSTALMLEHGLGRPDEAAALVAAVDVALVETPTPDLGGRATTSGFSDAVVAALGRS